MSKMSNNIKNDFIIFILEKPDKEVVQEAGDNVMQPAVMNSCQMPLKYLI